MRYQESKHQMELLVKDKSLSEVNTKFELQKEKYENMLLKQELEIMKLKQK